MIDIPIREEYTEKKYGIDITSFLLAIFVRTYEYCHVVKNCKYHRS